MAAHHQALIRQLPRRTGQKEERWAQVVGGDVIETTAMPEEHPAPASLSEPLSARMARLEEKVSALEEAFQALKQQLGA